MSQHILRTKNMEQVSLRFYTAAVGLFFLSFVAGFALSAMAQEADQSLVEQLGLKTFEALQGNLSVCGDDAKCVSQAKRIKSFQCAAGVCDGRDKSQKAIDCFEGGFKQSPPEVRDQIEASMCSLIESPSALTRQAFLKHISDNETTEDELVEFGAYNLALKGDAQSCENYIKNNIGSGSFQWYRALSGCRILAGEKTLVLEEKDYDTWLKVKEGSGTCSGIINSEIRKACTLAEKFPTP